MKPLCASLQERLSRFGTDILAKDETLQTHCAECQQCFAFLEALEQLDPLLRSLPEHDVDERVVESLLTKVENTPANQAVDIVNRRQLDGLNLRNLPAILKRGFEKLPDRENIQQLFTPLRIIAVGTMAMVLVTAQRSKDWMPVRSRQQAAVAPAGEQYADLIQAFKQEIDAERQKSGEMNELAAKTSEELKDHKTKVAAVLESVVNKFDNVQTEVDSLAASLKQQPEATALEQSRALNGPDTLDAFGYNDEASLPPPPPSPPLSPPPARFLRDSDVDERVIATGKFATEESNSGIIEFAEGADRDAIPEAKDSLEDAPAESAGQKTNLKRRNTPAPSRTSTAPASPRVITPGDAVSVTLLTGVNAPVDGTPYPVVFKLDGPITGANGEQIELKDARLIAAAQGSESDSRALFRLTKLAIRQADGSRKVVDIDGWIVGEDGIRGTPGKLEDKLGRLIASTGDLQRRMALGEESAATENLSPDASALVAASNQLSAQLLNRYEKLVPVVSVNAGKNLSAVFSKSSDLSSLVPQTSPAQTTAVESFLKQLTQVDGVSFQEARGYWENTYIPGDAGLRRLQLLLQGADRSFLNALSSTPLRLHDAARKDWQPYDAPRDSALSLYVSSSAPSISAPTRSLVQIGIQGAEQRGTRRPPMNIAIVADLRDSRAPVEERSLVREVLLAFQRAKEIGDRFSVTLVGPASTTYLKPEQFLHGQLTVALQNIAQQTNGAGTVPSLSDAVESAVARVSEPDETDNILGSNEVLLLAPGALTADIEALEKVAHRSSVDGIPVSVIGIGTTATGKNHDRLALAGQGTRRTISNVGEAAEIVKKEIAVVSSTVARALRLNIKLAPGVKLVQVLGSSKLTSKQVDAAKEVEQSIDQRVQKDLGIVADRDTDDDGIQVLIPSFRAGDTHVILLDVVANGPGRIAAASLKYKDLIYLRNGTSNTVLSVPDANNAFGRLELNVIKNRLSFELSRVLFAASEAVSSGDAESAAARIEAFKTLVLGLESRFPGLTRDEDFKRDQNLLTEYSAVLRGLKLTDGQSKEFLRNSLALASKLKISPLPPEL